VFAQDSQSPSLAHHATPTRKPVDRNRGTAERLTVSANTATRACGKLIETSSYAKGNVRFHIFAELFQNNTPLFNSVAVNVRNRCGLNARESCPATTGLLQRSEVAVTFPETKCGGRTAGKSREDAQGTG
jgi:hypothetical protein